MSCGSTSTRCPGWAGRRSGRWRWSPGRCSPTSGSPDGRRPRARAVSISMRGSSRGGRLRRCAVPRWHWPARSSGGHRSWPPPSGGRRSGTGCSWTTTRTPRTARWRRPTRSGRPPTGGSQRRSPGMRFRTAIRRTSRSIRSRPGLPASAICGRAWMPAPGRWTRCSNRRTGTRRRACRTPRGRRITTSRPESRRGCSHRSGGPVRTAARSGGPPRTAARSAPRSRRPRRGRTAGRPGGAAAAYR
jgi:hypothetical protein